MKNVNVVVIGGGSGNYSVLKSLKPYTKKNKISLSAIVSVTDSGGSSGILRDEFDVLPPGDIRKCLIALSEDTEIMKKLFSHRFESNGSLSDHSFGNLFLTALTQILGSEDKAILEAQKLLKVNGKVIPVTLEKTHIIAELDNGEKIHTESAIDLPRKSSNKKITKLYLENKAFPTNDAINSIQNADIIILGPGDVFTSIIPNLLVEDISKEILKSKALKIYNCNIMTKFGETNNYTVQDHKKEIEKYLVGNCINIVTYNTKKISKNMLEKYKNENASQVNIDKEKLENDKTNYVGADFVKETDLARHDTTKLGKVLFKIIKKYKTNKSLINS